MLVRVPAAREGSERIWRFGRSDKPDRFPTFGIQNPRRRDEHPHKTPCSASPEPILIRFDYLRRLLSVGRLTTRTDRGWPSDHSTGLFTYAGDTGPPGEVVFLGSHPRLASLPFAASTDAAELAGIARSMQIGQAPFWNLLVQFHDEARREWQNPAARVARLLPARTFVSDTARPLQVGRGCPRWPSR